jgi:hypothetical protein
MCRQCAAKSLPRRPSGRSSLAVIISALLVSPIVALGQASTVEVRWRNAERAKDMQVYVIDRIAKKEYKNDRQITPGGTGTARVMQDGDKYIDIMFSIVMKDDKGASTYRYICRRTSATGSVSFDLSLGASSGSPC